MHARIEFEYGTEATIKGMERAAYAALRDDYFPGWPEKPSDWSSWTHGREVLVDLTIVGAPLSEAGLEYKVKRFIGCRKVATPDKTVNLQVAIPNLLLFSVDEVELLEDACTDNLQSHLNEGWRILAVCPPANQRRPDYILGRQRSAHP